MNADSIEIAGIAIIQVGHVLFGIGSTERTAIADANRSGLEQHISKHDLKMPGRGDEGDLVRYPATRGLMGAIAEGRADGLVNRPTGWQDGRDDG